jgi:hypothetical protein
MLTVPTDVVNFKNFGLKDATEEGKGKTSIDERMAG